MHEYTNYFKENAGFERFINKLYLKYRSLGHFSGIVTLEKISKDEAKNLSRLFAENFEKNSTVKISVSKFIKIMEASKYEDFDISILTSEYLDKPLITNKEKRRSESEKEMSFYQSIIGTSEGSKFLKYVVDAKEKPYDIIHKRYKKDKKSLKEELSNLIKLLDNLPKENTLLPIFSSDNTKDPHYLDLDKSHINLFLYGLSYLNDKPFPIKREDKVKLLYENKIEIDLISNFCTTYNILSNEEYINGFSKHNQTLILNLQNIQNIREFDTDIKKVFIFENPSILTEILSKKIEVPVIITNGFAGLSLYELLDKLIKNDNKLYYNGDFDPEGLLIASNLKEKYDDKLKLICYGEKDYEKCKSNREISNSRLKKLKTIQIKELEIVKIS